MADRPDIASYDLGTALGLTQKTGWLMLKRIYDAPVRMLEANMADSEDRRIIAAWPAYSVTRDGSI